MSYVGSDGTVYHGSRPWGIGKIVDIFWGFINLVVAFFQTLVPGLSEGNSRSGPIGYGAPKTPRPPGPPRRNIRGFGSVSSWQPPPCGPSGG